MMASSDSRRIAAGIGRTVGLVPLWWLAVGAAPLADVVATPFGTLSDGRKVNSYVLKNDSGLAMTLIDRGATIASISAPDRNGTAEEITAAPGSLAGIVASNQRYGAIVGRYAGRLSGGFTLDGKRYDLQASRSGVTLHGGDPGLDSALWVGRPFADRKEVGVEFSLLSRAGEQGFPANLTITVRYALERKRNRLTITTYAVSDAPTFANLTNHTYYDLSGRRSLDCQVLQADAGGYIETDQRMLPTGKVPSVAGTSLDITRPISLAAKLAATDPVTVARRGFNDTLALDKGGAVRLWDGKSGRTLVMRTTEPAVVVYTANGLNGTDRDAQNRPLLSHSSIALEAERYPDSPAHSNFPTTLVKPGQPYRARTTISFDVDRLEGKSVAQAWRSLVPRCVAEVPGTS